MRKFIHKLLGIKCKELDERVTLIENIIGIKTDFMSIGEGNTGSGNVGDVPPDVARFQALQKAKSDGNVGTGNVGNVGGGNVGNVGSGNVKAATASGGNVGSGNVGTGNVGNVGNVGGGNVGEDVPSAVIDNQADANVGDGNVGTGSTETQSLCPPADDTGSTETQSLCPPADGNVGTGNV